MSMAVKMREPRTKAPHLAGMYGHRVSTKAPSNQLRPILNIGELVHRVTLCLDITEPSLAKVAEFRAYADAQAWNEDLAACCCHPVSIIQ